MNTVADTNCYGCLSTGRIIGFGSDGAECTCVAHCEECDGAIAWRHDDERAPILCAACSCPATVRSTHDGLATWLVRYEDSTGTHVEPGVAYVDAVSAEAAEAVVRGWACGEGLIFADGHGSYDVAAWERGVARRFYREQAGDLS